MHKLFTFSLQNNQKKIEEKTIFQTIWYQMVIYFICFHVIIKMHVWLICTYFIVDKHNCFRQKFKNMRFSLKNTRIRIGFIFPDYRRENFTIERRGLYIIYFHFNFRVPTNYSNSPFRVTISITDSLDTVLLSQTRQLQKPMPNGGYENVVLFESLKLRRGTYFMKLDVSDKHTLYSYIGSKGLTVYKVW